MKLLLVEDEVYSRQSLRKQILSFDTGKQFELLEASNGKQGWEIFQKESPELVLLDIKMPFMSGLELLNLIRQCSSDTYVIMVSGYADFEYAQNALNNGAAGYLLKPVKDQELGSCLNKFLKQNAEEKRHQEELILLKDDDSLTQGIYQNIQSDVSVNSYVNDTIFEKMFHPYVYMSFYFSGSDCPSKLEVFEIIKQVLQKDLYVDFRLLTFSKRSFGLILKETPGFSTYLRRFVHKLEDQNFRCVVGVSMPHQGLKNVRDAYEQAQIALKSKLFYHESVLFYRTVWEEHQDRFQVDDPQMELLTFYLEQADSVSAVSLTEQMLSQMFQVKHLSISSVENFLMQLTIVFHRIVSQGEVKSEENIEQKLEFHFLHYSTPEVIRQKVRERIELLCSCKERMQMKMTASNIVDAVLAYTETHYNSNLSLKDLAEKVFFLTPSYLSHLITEKTGKNYSSYLKEVRVRKAKEYLKNPNLSITQVATLSGYNDTSQFIHIFKKEEGVTPKKFRLLLEKKKEPSKHDE